jgi:glutaredoxin-related protein
MSEKTLLPIGIQTFSKIIKGNYIYVDKTSYIEKMIDMGAKAFFLARPRYFGKSLTVSTLKSLFSGDKELFKGLAIENRLDEPKFAPRPVIHLDMISAASSEGHADFKISLACETGSIAETLGIIVPKKLTTNDIFSTIIRKCADKFKNRVAILIDEYDTPVTTLLHKPDEVEKVRFSLIDYFRQLKACDECISLIFVTGITKYARCGFSSGLNSILDISSNSRFGGITGFTYNEIQLYFERQLKKVAQANKLTKKQLQDKMKEYYNGFCFDGETELYKPSSTLLFFEHKSFDKF